LRKLFENQTYLIFTRKQAFVGYFLCLGLRLCQQLTTTTTTVAAAATTATSSATKLNLTYSKIFIGQ
jgi:hypothetical protein